jgi:protein gp37
MSTKIGWVKNIDGSKGVTWNPVTGCSKVSEGCLNCYAERMSKRLAGRCGYPADDPFRVTLHPRKLCDPVFLAKKKTIFVCSMSDLFHEDVPFEFIDDVFRRARSEYGSCLKHGNNWHDFIFLTKRPLRLKEFWDWHKNRYDHYPSQYEARNPKISQHIWLGVTAENQQRADERIHVLLQIPAAVHFVSIEPMLSEVDLNLRKNMIDWVICGGETSPGARPLHPDWVRSLRDQCQEAGTPFFFKSWGEFVPFGPEHGGPWYTSLIDAKRCINMCHFEDGRKIKTVSGLQSNVFRVGKKAAGRLLDGLTWDEMPAIMEGK